MAYVAISGHLIERVKDKISAMRQAELKTVGDCPFKFGTHSDALDQAIWGEHLSLKAQMPDHWKTELERVKLCFEKDQRKYDIHVPCDKYLATPGFYTYDTVKVDFESAELAPFVAWANQRYDVDHRWDHVREKVVGFLYSCKSLNEALKLWPEVEVYVHKDDIARTQVKREKPAESKALEALKSIDVEAMQSAAVIARLSGAQI